MKLLVKLFFKKQHFESEDSIRRRSPLSNPNRLLCEFCTPARAASSVRYPARVAAAASAMMYCSKTKEKDIALT
jgi:hypothetical protein